MYLFTGPVASALPGCVQVSDRWHLWHGLAEAAAKEVAAHSACWAEGAPLQEGKRARLRLLEKGNKEKLVWLHREAEEFLDAYIAAAGIDDKEAPLFQSVDKAHRLTGERA